MNVLLRICTRALLLALPLFLIVLTAEAQTRTYTEDADFDEGTLVNVNHNPSDQLQLDSQATPFNFVWVAASGLNTIVKIDTQTGQVLGEYLSRPSGMFGNPSRTTVDNNGNVWVGNRDESSGGLGSAVHVGLLENGQCVDRHGPGGVGPPDGVIQTSTGLGDVKPWTNAGGADTNGGVSTAEDECIIHYVRTAATNVRTVTVDPNNDVWIGGIGNLNHQLHDGATGAPMGPVFNFGCGGYGGLLDANGVLWSARIGGLLRFDTVANTGTCIGISNSYGLGIDGFGNVWNSQWTNNTITKLNPAGGIMGTFATGGSGSRGVVATSDNDIWVANSVSNTVTRLSNAGALKATIPVGNHPTGVAVDVAGKVWVTNLGSDDAMRINPATDMVDLTVPIRPGSSPYNYSDMTGSTLIAPPNSGTWTVVYDSGISGVEWGFVTWTSSEPGDSQINVTAASSPDGITFGPPETVSQGVDLTVADGQYLKVSVSFTRASAPPGQIGATPVLYDLTITANRPPDCANAFADPDELWPPNHKMRDVNVLGVTDPDGDPVNLIIDSIFQDEPVNGNGDGNTWEDGIGVGSYPAQVRAERAGTKKVPGDGRVYHIGFTADDGQGGECSGAVTVCVPHDQRPGHVCVDQGPLYDSTDDGTSPRAMTAQTPIVFEVGTYPNPFNPVTTITYTLPEAAHVQLTVYDVTGREVTRLVDGSAETGTHQVVFDASRLPSGVYLYRVQAGALVKSGTMLLVK